MLKKLKTNYMKKLLLILLVLPTLIISQTQIGQDIDGEGIFNQSGDAVSLSSDGSILAIGAAFNNGNGNNSGHVRVYENIGGVWTQIGQDIDGEAENDYSGYSVNLSSDGSIVAIGAVGNDGIGFDSGHVRVYEYNGVDEWIQIGQDIDGEADLDRSGDAVSLSSNGSIIAIGAVRNNGASADDGHVRVYENIGGTWTQIGQDIDGGTLLAHSGRSVSLSSNGAIVAIGSPFNNGTSSLGRVRVYEIIGSVWTQIGSDIVGEDSGDRSGSSVSLSSDGSIVAIGAPLNDGNGYHSGQVRVYENTGGVWTQIGSDIDGEDENDWLGKSVSLSSDGSLLAIGAWEYNGLGTEFGYVQLYENQANNWIKLGSNIIGEEVDDGNGISVSLSSDGSIMAIGAGGNDGSFTDSGSARVYDFSSVLSSESFKFDYFRIYPNPVQNLINIELNQVVELEKVNIYNTLGQFIYSTKDLKIDTSNFESGIYFIEIETNKGKSAKKIVVE